MSVTVLTKEVSLNDYYEINHHAKTLAGVPIYFFDLQVTRADHFTVTLKSAESCLRVRRILVLGPNGRVVASVRNRTQITFPADAGKYLIKQWISDTCDTGMWNDSSDYGANLQSDDIERDHRMEYDALYTVEVSSLNGTVDTISVADSKIRVYSLLGSREGTLHKGEMLKEKCLERYIPCRLPK